MGKYITLKKAIFCGVFTLLLLVPSKFVYAIEAEGSACLLVKEKEDIRVNKLKKFLGYYQSPLKYYANFLVKTADKYGLDWRLIPAITGVESTFGKAIPEGSFNAYGWANGAYYFDSWSQSIEVVAKALRQNYVDRGADTVEKIAPIYAPPSKTWAYKVNFYMEKIENFNAFDPKRLELSY
jgi:hypothetical protein